MLVQGKVYTGYGMLEEKTGFSCGNMEENHVDIKGLEYWVQIC